jgi:hypothetical protein
LLNMITLIKFKDKHPMYSSIDAAKLKKVITSFNGKLRDTVLNNRNGVELPESLGYLFIGSCPAAKKVNVDYALSKQYGKLIQNKNWDTDGHVGKIFYTNYSPKYKFKTRELWQFTAARQFKRAVAKFYPKNWKKFVTMKTKIRVTNMYKKKEE